MSVHPPSADASLDREQLTALQAAADEVFVHDAVARLRGAARARDPRAGRARPRGPRPADRPRRQPPRDPRLLVAAGRALALLRGRGIVLPQDVYDVGRDVLRHRVLLTYEALADGVDVEEIVERIVRTVLAPRVTPDPGRPGRGASAS